MLLYVTIAVATGLGFAASLVIGEAYPVLAGLGMTAYVLGLRHGFDADHLARYRAYAGDGIFRVSVGLETAEDLCADLDQALRSD